jgi:hypothetical protein
MQNIQYKLRIPYAYASVTFTKNQTERNQWPTHVKVRHSNDVANA